ncbi:CDP-diacylglycerol--glycerol-3-phosphate 3-phosphatidyltransferase [Morus notabilis]|uniref:CDP-diacylglycerol--glycerol-3-phosphate 1-phosphatidyltransferase n=1 Tax=Morus notabilis TaxID=981085 RepID=W9RFS6_9ROSA|nr:CDP-diacylglycerol--glycerol-3-phosphate 3-phosphatidyltransferase 2 [Morus notabilis]EXB88497.1 CDP-diacylglycerol--glycerol-3-phosphate 3-phosphatidyltransferase [Morus notabilis]
MSGVVVKLGMAVPKPNHAQKLVWVRSSGSTTPLSLSLSLNKTHQARRENNHNNNRLILLSVSPTSTAIYRDGFRRIGWRRCIPHPCAPPAHDKKNPSHPPPKNPPLGFSSFSSSENRGALSASSSSSSSSLSEAESGGLVVDMGSENKHQDFNGKEVNQDLKQSASSSKFLTLPTVLTLGRVAAVPLLIGTFYVDSWWGPTATTSIFIAAAITDWLDGYIARKMRLGSAFGAFLDPVADKLMVAGTLILLCTRPFDVPGFGQVPWLLTVPVIAIIGREITMSAVREWAASQNTKLLEAVAVNNLGKWKTATQMTALTILLATRDSSLGAPGFLVASGVVLLYVSAGLAFWSLVVYMSKIWRVLMR